MAKVNIMVKFNFPVDRTRRVDPSTRRVPFFSTTPNPTLLVEFSKNSTSSPSIITSRKSTSDSPSSSWTRRVYLHNKNVSSMWIAELYEQLVESVFMSWEMALDSSTTFLHSSSPMVSRSMALSISLSPLPGLIQIPSELKWAPWSHNSFWEPTHDSPSPCMSKSNYLISDGQNSSSR